MLSEKKAVILVDNTKVIIRLMDGEFIKYKDIIANKFKIIPLIKFFLSFNKYSALS